MSFVAAATAIGLEGMAASIAAGATVDDRRMQEG